MKAHPSRKHLDRLAYEQTDIEATLRWLQQDLANTRRQVAQHGQRVEAAQLLASAWERAQEPEVIPWSDPVIDELFPPEPEQETTQAPWRATQAQVDPGPGDPPQGHQHESERLGCRVRYLSIAGEQDRPQTDVAEPASCGGSR